MNGDCPNIFENVLPLDIDQILLFQRLSEPHDFLTVKQHCFVVAVSG
jgi:hypothetical protein